MSKIGCVSKRSKMILGVWICLFTFFIGIGVQASELRKNIFLQEPQIVSVSAPENVTTALRITWKPVANADGYILYRKTGYNSEWERIKKIAGQSQSYYSNIKLEPGKKYTYTVQAFCKVDGKVYYSKKENNQLSAVTHLKTPALKATRSVSGKEIKIAWETVQNATGYRIYRREEGIGWRLIDTVSWSTDGSIVDSHVQLGKKYYYTVRAVCSWDGKTYMSGYDQKGILGQLLLVTPQGFKVCFRGNDVVVTWMKSAGADGYVVMRSTQPDGTYKKIKTVQGMNSNLYLDTSTANDSAYYYKVRAFKQVNGRFVYSKYTEAKSISKKMIEIMDYIPKQYNREEIVEGMKQITQKIGGSLTLGTEIALLDLTNARIWHPGLNNVKLWVVNAGNNWITLFGIQIGDTEATAKGKLLAVGFKEHEADKEGYSFGYHDGKIELEICLKIKNGKLSGYEMAQYAPVI